ncbi:MAG: MFS transporter [Syntrophaceae bacterium]|nr:MFS transporter [Syntrophaceae bacterium]
MNYKALALLAAGHLVTDINTGALPALLPFIKQSLQLSYTMSASIILVFNITSSVIQPVFGYFSDRWSARWLLPAGCLIAPLGLGLLGLGTSYAWIFVFAALSGLGQGSYHPEGFKTVNFLSQERKATAISLFLVGGSLGLSLGPFLATLFFKYLGLKGSLLFLPIGIAMGVIFLVTPHWKVKIELPLRKAKGRGVSTAAQQWAPMALLLLAVVFRAAALLSLKAFVPFYFINVLHRDPLVVGKYLSTFLLAGTVGSLAGGAVGDRYDYKKTALLGLGLTTLFLWLFFYTSGTESLIFFALAGLTLNVSNPITMAIGQSYMPHNLGMASGLILGLAMGVGGIGTTIFGWVADHWGLGLTLQIIFLLPLFAALTFFFIPYPARLQKKQTLS